MGPIQLSTMRFPLFYPLYSEREFVCVSVIFPTDKEEEAVFPIKLPLLSPFLALVCAGETKKIQFFLPAFLQVN